MLYEQVNHTCETDLIQTNGSRNQHIIHINDKSGPFFKSYLCDILLYVVLFWDILLYKLIKMGANYFTLNLYFVTEIHNIGLS